jgi:hypothetical protein
LNCGAELHPSMSSPPLSLQTIRFLLLPPCYPSQSLSLSIDEKFFSTPPYVDYIIYWKKEIVFLFISLLFFQSITIGAVVRGQEVGGGDGGGRGGGEEKRFQWRIDPRVAEACAGGGTYSWAREKGKDPPTHNCTHTPSDWWNDKFIQL